MCCPLQDWRSLFVCTNVSKKRVEIEKTIRILCEFAHVLALQVALQPFRADATSWDDGAEPFHRIRVVKVELCCFIQNISNIRAVSRSARWSLCSDCSLVIFSSEQSGSAHGENDGPSTTLPGWMCSAVFKRFSLLCTNRECVGIFSQSAFS